MSKIFLNLILIVFIMMSLQADEPPTPPKRIIGYFAGWTVDRDYWVTDIPADKLTHINYAFANISDDGEIMLGDEWLDTQIPYADDVTDDPLQGHFRQLNLLKEANPHLQTLISVGGWAWSDNFSDVALTEESRQRFVSSSVDFILEYGFDGIDLDWEYPTGGGEAGNIERPVDVANFVLLLEEMRRQLDEQGAIDGRHYLLTIAVGAGKWAYEPLDWEQIHPLLDFINVMTYDMSGGWSSRTGFNAPLYPSSSLPVEGMSTHTTVQGILAQGVPADKLVMGVPFYGRGWVDTRPVMNGLHQLHGGVPEGTDGAVHYVDLVENYLPRYSRFWHERSQVPWLYDEESGHMISYDDPESLKLKADYVVEHGLGGVMFWELSGDTADSDLLTTIYDSLNPE